MGGKIVGSILMLLAVVVAVEFRRAVAGVELIYQFITGRPMPILARFVCVFGITIVVWLGFLLLFVIDT